MKNNANRVNQAPQNVQYDLAIQLTEIKKANCNRTTFYINALSISVQMFKFNSHKTYD